MKAWITVCAAAAFFTLASPASAQTGPEDLISACSGILSTLRALPAANGNAQTEQAYTASRDSMANAWAYSSDVESLQRRLASDAAYWAANPESNRIEHAGHVISDVNDCMIRRRLVQIEQGQRQTQQQREQRQPQAQAAPRAAPQRQALNSPRRTRDTSSGVTPSRNQPAQAQPKPPEKKKIVGVPAHKCLALDKSGDYGGFINNCDFIVRFTFCAEDPKPGSDASYADCAKFKAGSDGLAGAEPHTRHGDFVKSAKHIYWFACQDPSRPKSITYRPHQGLFGSCG